MEQEIRIAMDQFRKLVEEQQERARKLKENRDASRQSLQKLWNN